MPFCVVQTRKTKKSLPSLTVVPSTWVEEKFVYWPPSNLISLSTKEDSLPDKNTWIKQKCKLLGRARTFQQAEDVMSTLEKMTDSEDAAQMGIGTRSTPAKKHAKFKSKSYQLVPSATPHYDSVAVTDAATSSKGSRLHHVMPVVNPSQPSHVECVEVGEPSHCMSSSAPSEPGLSATTLHRRIYDANSEALRHDFVQPVMTSSNVNSPTIRHQSSCNPEHEITDQNLRSSTSNSRSASSENTGRMQYVPVSSAVNVASARRVQVVGSVSSQTVQPIISNTPIINSVSSQESSTATSARINRVSNVNAAMNISLHSTSDAWRRAVPSSSFSSSVSHTVVPARLQNQITQNNDTINDTTNSQNLVTQQIALPIVMGSDGNHYAQLANGAYYPLAEIHNEMVEEPILPIIKQDEVDMGVNEDLNITDSIQGLNETDYSTIAIELHKINARLGDVDTKISVLSTEVSKMNERLDSQEGLLTQLTQFMANFNKLMSSRNALDATLTAQRSEEDFSEFESMKLINNDQDFKTFEQSLCDPKYSGKFFRYLNSVYSLNGKRDSGPLFRTIIRKLIAPNVFLPYSWMGNKRARPGLAGDSGQNINFQEQFPNFIKTMHQVLQAADCSSTREQNDNLFKNLLRYKMLELKRFESGNGERRASSSRINRKKQKVADDPDVPAYGAVKAMKPPQEPPQELTTQTTLEQHTDQNHASSSIINREMQKVDGVPDFEAVEFIESPQDDAVELTTLTTVEQTDESDMSECDNGEDSSETD